MGQSKDDTQLRVLWMGLSSCVICSVYSDEQQVEAQEVAKASTQALVHLELQVAIAPMYCSGSAIGRTTKQQIT